MKILKILLIIGMTFSSIVVANTFATADAGESDTLTMVDNSTIMKELKAKRTIYSKSFFNKDDKTVTVEINGNPIHYQDSQGKFKDIDKTIIENKNSTGLTQAGQGPRSASVWRAPPAEYIHRLLGQMPAAASPQSSTDLPRRRKHRTAPPTTAASVGVCRGY